MVQALEWSGQAGFVSESLRPWTLNGTDVAAGNTKTFGDLTWATIHNAGHMVSSLHLFVMWGRCSSDWVSRSRLTSRRKLSR